MLGNPHVLFPDARAWAITYLRAALPGRAETYASGVTVAARTPETMPTRLVTIRDDGGTRNAVTKLTSLGVNVWAESDAVASNLAALVTALLEASAGNGTVVAHVSTSGPVDVVEPSTKPHRYVSVDLLIRGTDL